MHSQGIGGSSDAACRRDQYQNGQRDRGVTQVVGWPAHGPDSHVDVVEDGAHDEALQEVSHGTAEHESEGKPQKQLIGAAPGSREDHSDADDAEDRREGAGPLQQTEGDTVVRRRRQPQVRADEVDLSIQRADDGVAENVNERGGDANDDRQEGSGLH